MSDAVIQVEGLGKRYRIRHQQRERYTALRDVLAERAKRLFGRGDSAATPPVEDFWALRDVSFEVKQGEVLGIIGRNGAGKSTLLKILSRITDPSEGEVRVRGRVGSLLEVGTGFHPELTGRENIFLNGAILGMSRSEIKRKFDEIVAFAEVEKFLDTPVKRYSSGMYVRLAFAVAAHLEPEILIVDEVLAVGDAAFQKKCLGRMGEVAKTGRTVLFVSHHMPSINRLCRRSILLDAGRIKLDGNVNEVSTQYLHSDLGTSAERRWEDAATAPGDNVARLKAIRVLSDGVVTDTVDIRYPVTIEMDYWNHRRGAVLLAAISFVNDEGTHLFVSSDRFSSHCEPAPKEAGLHRARCTVPGNLFAEGAVRVVAEVSTSHPTYQIHFLEYDSAAFQVIDCGEPGSVRGSWARPIPGMMRPAAEWEVMCLEPQVVA